MAQFELYTCSTFISKLSKQDTKNRSLIINTCTRRTILPVSLAFLQSLVYYMTQFKLQLFFLGSN